MPTNDYRKLVALIEKTLGSKKAKISEPKFIQGQGLENFREVDILIEDTIGPYSLKIAIEATDLGKRLGVAKLDSLIQKYRGEGRVAVDKFVVVTRLGYTDDAIEKATLADVELLTLKEAEELDWSKYGLKPNLNIAFAVQPRICQIQVEPPIPNTTFPDRANANLICCHGTSFGPLIQYLFKTIKLKLLKDRPTAFQELHKKALADPMGGAHLNVRFPFPHQMFLEIRGKRHEVTHASFAIHQDASVRPAKLECIERTSNKGGVQRFMRAAANMGKHSLDFILPMDGLEGDFFKKPPPKIGMSIRPNLTAEQRKALQKKRQKEAKARDKAASKKKKRKP